MKCKNAALKHNLKPQESKALHELSKRNDIIISHADKGSAVVIQDVKYYVKEVEQQLDNNEYFEMFYSNKNT